MKKLLVLAAYFAVMMYSCAAQAVVIGDPVSPTEPVEARIEFGLYTTPPTWEIRFPQQLWSAALNSLSRRRQSTTGKSVSGSTPAGQRARCRFSTSTNRLQNRMGRSELFAQWNLLCMTRKGICSPILSGNARGGIQVGRPVPIEHQSLLAHKAPVKRHTHYF